MEPWSRLRHRAVCAWSYGSSPGRSPQTASNAVSGSNIAKHSGKSTLFRDPPVVLFVLGFQTRHPAGSSRKISRFYRSDPRLNPTSRLITHTAGNFPPHFSIIEADVPGRLSCPCLVRTSPNPAPYHHACRQPFPWLGEGLLASLGPPGLPPILSGPDPSSSGQKYPGTSASSFLSLADMNLLCTSPRAPVSMEGTQK